MLNSYSPLTTGETRDVWRTRHEREETANSPQSVLPCLALTCMESGWAGSYLTDDGTACKTLSWYPEKTCSPSITPWITTLRGDDLIIHSGSERKTKQQSNTPQNISNIYNKHSSRTKCCWDQYANCLFTYVLHSNQYPCPFIFSLFPPHTQTFTSAVTTLTTVN